MRKVFVSMSALLVISLFAACGGNQQGGGAQGAAAVPPEDIISEISGEITFWTQNVEVWTDWFIPAIQEFRRTHPNITVNDEYFPSFADRVSHAFAAGEEPDVIQTWQSITEWASAGRLLPVPDSLGLNRYYFDSAIINVEHNGRLYGVPSEINLESPLFFVNMDLLAREGVELPDNWIANDGPSTWQELVDFARPLTVIQGDMVMQAGFAYTFAQWESMFVSLIWQLGGDYRDPANNRVNFVTPEAAQAMEFMLRYNDPASPYVISDRSENRYNIFVQGNAAMVKGAPWYASAFAVDNPGLNYQVFRMPPMISGSDPISLAAGGWGYIVSSQTNYPEAAWAFVDFMNSAEMNGDWAMSVGTLPARNDAVMNLDFDPNVGSVEKALSLAQDVLPYANEGGAYMLTPSRLIYSIIRLQLQQVLETGDIQAALQAIERYGNEMIAENLGL